MQTTRQEAIDSVRGIALAGILSEQEVQEAYRSGIGNSKSHSSSHVPYGDIFYHVGAFVAFLGVAVLIGNNWNILSGLTKLLTTLGFSLIAYIVGVLLNRYQKMEAISQSFQILAALVLPIGLYVVFKGAGYDLAEPSTGTLIATILFAFYAVSAYFFRREVFTFFSILYGTAFFYYLSYLLVVNTLWESSANYPLYLILAIGVSYLFLGYYFYKQAKFGFTAFLYVIGLICLLGTTVWLGGWAPDNSLFWELSYPAILFAVFYLSVYLHNRVFLVFAAIFLMIYLLKITTEYFSEGLDWPFALVLAGLSLIGVGYLLMYLNGKYLSKRRSKAIA